MKKTIFLSCFLTILLQGETTQNLSLHVQRVLPSIVKIKVQKSEPNDENELTATDSGGSGFVLDNEHRIITNAHVISDAKKISIIDAFNREYSAKLIAKDDKTDIAVLESSTFNAPVLNESNVTVSPGESVFAIGSPFSLGHSVTYGIVSANNRFLANYPYVRFIQIDAAINPGNSGGALFNQNGELIGMNSTYYSKQGNYTNIGFAIPVSDVRRIANRLIQENPIQRGYFGADLLLSERISRKLGHTASVYVGHVEPNSPADKSGLRTGDAIVAINNTQLSDGGEFHRYLEQSKANQTINLTFYREKQRINSDLILGTYPNEKKESTNAGSGDESEKMGLIVREESGIVRVVIPFQTARSVGIEAGDTIREVNKQSISTIKELNNFMAKLKDNEMALIKIERGTKLIIVPIGTKTAIKAYLSNN
jgi:serine protease Do